MPTPSREVHLVRRPEGPLAPGDFSLVEAEVRDPAEGEVLVRNLLMSVDPALRPRMSVGQPLDERPQRARRETALSRLRPHLRFDGCAAARGNGRLCRAR